MAKNRVAQNPELDPTMPKVELKLGGKTYFLVFTFAALALAEAKLREQGITANLLVSLDIESWDASKFVPLLFATLITHQPNITPVEVANMVQFRDLPNIYTALQMAWVESIKPQSDKASADPLAPAE